MKKLESSDFLKFEPSWQEMQAGWRLGLVTLSAAVDFGVHRMEKGDESPIAKTLASADLERNTEAARAAIVDEIFHSLDVDERKVSDDEVLRFWCFIRLSSLDATQRPDTHCRLVDETYADFGYPEALGACVSYDPTPSSADFSAAFARYLSDEAKHFSQSDDR